ncbi:MAG TPA: cupredoxin domain-containing protein [Actinomycetota bacterium]|nr:cupredoxin domain-containing protein [Actinomycetota bacterium]
MLRRPVALWVALLAAAAPAACSAATGAPAARTVPITIHYSHFSPARLTVAAGETVRFTITNTDPIDHEFILGDEAVQDREEAGTDLIHDGSVPGMVSAPAGRTVSTVVSFPRHPAERSLVYACHLPGHYAYGMRGVLTITS